MGQQRAINDDEVIQGLDAHGRPGRAAFPRLRGLQGGDRVGRGVEGPRMTPPNELSEQTDAMGVLEGVAR
jgi:hypothetical protein